ncbi:Cupredoxin [Corchorus capsularis]|uniref:Cupredoxin n=1 Tax=Corchorus capsularis TaxID=210143 RepID=A0A1R3G8G1_COCAP|nr:Cupredoxin [Corchorus capsularis]
MGLVKRGVVFLMMMMMVALHGVSRAAEYKVGDSIGWTVPADGFSDYKNWAAQHRFYPGDVLVFVYNMQFHDVQQVHVEDFKSCNSKSPITSFNNGTDNITLSTSGEYYFLCSYPGHCPAGQKIHITVNSAAQSPSHNASPAPPNNAAQSLHAFKHS